MLAMRGLMTASPRWSRAFWMVLLPIMTQRVRRAGSPRQKAKGWGVSFASNWTRRPQNCACFFWYPRHAVWGWESGFLAPAWALPRRLGTSKCSYGRMKATRPPAPCTGPRDGSWWTASRCILSASISSNKAGKFGFNPLAFPWRVRYIAPHKCRLSSVG